MGEKKQPSDKDALLRASERVRVAASERVSSLDPRTHAAWRTWLAALAKDAAAATAAALAYESLPGGARDAWLDALDADAPNVGVPEIALYAPLLGVEADEARRDRIAKHVTGAPTRGTPPTALVGGSAADRVCIIISPLYLDFVEILCCRYDQDQGIREAKHEWLAHKDEVAACVRDLGVTMAVAPLQHVVEELAHAVVADRRAGRDAPEALRVYIDLFAPSLASHDGAGERGGAEGSSHDE